MLLKYFKFIFIFLLLLVIGCTNTESGFSLDKLPDAIIDKPYSVVIRIAGGAMPNEKNLKWQITPDNSGLSIRSASVRGWFDEIELYGEPKIQGDINIHLKGFGYGSPPYHFDKTFILKVTSFTEETTSNQQ